MNSNLYTINDKSIEVVKKYVFVQFYIPNILCKFSVHHHDAAHILKLLYLCRL